jgi:hypothetical protein
MTKRMFAKRLMSCLLAGLLLAGCGSERVHSEYFIVAFIAGTPAEAPEGVAALANALDEARRATPRAIAITGPAPAAGAETALAKDRAQAIFDAFVKAGIDTSLVHTAFRAENAKDYAAGKDSFIIQLAYGDMPQP